MKVKLLPACNMTQEIKELFTEYTQMMIENDDLIGQYLQQQNYDKELQHLELKYGNPWGRLYIAVCGDKVAGCIGLRKIDNETCEVKRLYVRPEFRGQRIGEIMLKQIISDAQQIGYKKALLDTLPFMHSAIHIYKKLGFYEVPQYNDSPIDYAIYMQLDLQPAEIKPGKYRHFKGNEYEVIGVAKHSETLEPMVVYRALYGEGGIWVRPASMWDETIERDGQTFKRFTFIGE